jgi:hypothetical protein
MSETERQEIINEIINKLKIELYTGCYLSEYYLKVDLIYNGKVIDYNKVSIEELSCD